MNLLPQLLKDSLEMRELTMFKCFEVHERDSHVHGLLTTLHGLSIWFEEYKDTVGGFSQMEKLTLMSLFPRLLKDSLKMRELNVFMY